MHKLNSLILKRVLSLKQDSESASEVHYLLLLIQLISNFSELTRTSA